MQSAAPQKRPHINVGKRIASTDVSTRATRILPVNCQVRLAG